MAHIIYDQASVVLQDTSSVLLSRHHCTILYNNHLAFCCHSEYNQIFTIVVSYANNSFCLGSLMIVEFLIQWGLRLELFQETQHNVCGGFRFQDPTEDPKYHLYAYCFSSNKSITLCGLVICVLISTSLDYLLPAGTTKCHTFGFVPFISFICDCHNFSLYGLLLFCGIVLLFQKDKPSCIAVLLSLSITMLFYNYLLMYSFLIRPYIY